MDFAVSSFFPSGSTIPENQQELPSVAGKKATPLPCRSFNEEGRTYKSITAEYGVSKASISKWCSEFSKECQMKAQANPDAPNEMELMKENLRLRKELEEAKKENLFLKKAAAFFAKEID